MIWMFVKQFLIISLEWHFAIAWTHVKCAHGQAKAIGRIAARHWSSNLSRKYNLLYFVYHLVSIENYTATTPQVGARKLRRRKDPSNDSNANRPQMLSIVNYESLVNKKKKLPPVNINFSLGMDDIQDDLQNIINKGSNKRY